MEQIPPHLANHYNNHYMLPTVPTRISVGSGSLMFPGARIVNVEEEEVAPCIQTSTDSTVSKEKKTQNIALASLKKGSL